MPYQFSAQSDIKMVKEEFRAVRKIFYLKNWTAVQIEAELNEVHGDTTNVKDCLLLDYWYQTGPGVNER